MESRWCCHSIGPPDSRRSCTSASGRMQSFRTPKEPQSSSTFARFAEVRKDIKHESDVLNLNAYQQSAHMALLWYKQALLSLFTLPGGGWWPTNPFPLNAFFTEITTEAAARTLLWRSRFQGKEFSLPALSCRAILCPGDSTRSSHLQRLSATIASPRGHHLRILEDVSAALGQSAVLCHAG